MDAELEPVRCRRTDGRKWRCRLPVLPDQKYCQRHVNRGRLSSRKPVEVLKTFLNSKSTATTSVSLLKTTPNLQSHAKTELNKAGIKNQSMNIKKHSMENSCRPLQSDFSVKSVVQDGNGIALGVGASGNDHETVLSERCRRTDGRKWQCKKAVLPGMKYCVQHMHRGAKKVKNGQKLNPCLSFLVGATHQQAGSDGNQSNDYRSSSEATTISM